MICPSPCPDPNRLKGLLDSSLPEDEQARLVSHLDSCTGCQHSLEDLAVGDSPLAEAVRHVDRDRPSSESAFWPALHRLEDELTTRVERPPEPDPKEEPSLEFLAPADEPGYLGRLDHFNVEEVLGRGGMGLVLKAFDPCLTRHVAIKVLDPQLANNETARKRFCREARAAAQVTHENVVAIHAVDQEEGTSLPYLVMQLVAGESLQDYLDRHGALPLKDVLRVGAQVAAGLAAAHAHGLIHRDIKPANVLLEGGPERVKITDFGLARAAEDVKLTQTGFVTGTPLYMAPEQARGEEVDYRADLFSLGSVLYALCTGRPPFPGTTPYLVLRQVAEEKPRPVREINPEVPEWLEKVIAKLQAKDPADRFQSAAEVAEILGQHFAVLNTSTQVLCPPCESAEAARPAWQRRAAVGGGLLVALAAGAALALFFLNRDDPGTPARVTVPGLQGPVWSLSFAPSGDTLAVSGDGGEVKLLDATTGRVRKVFHAHAGPVWAMAFARKAGVLATVSDDGFARVWDPGTAKLLHEFKHSTSIRALAISADGRTLFTGGRNGKLRVIDVATRKDGATLAGHEGVVVALALSPDGKTLASASGYDKTVKLWDVATGQERVTLRHDGGLYAVAFSPDGRRVASGGYGKAVYLWDAETGEKVGTLVGHDQDVWSLAFSPDGKTLASGSEDRTVKLWDVAGGKVKATFKGHTGTVYAVAFAPDGKTLASGGRDGTVKLWDVPAE